MLNSGKPSNLQQVAKKDSALEVLQSVEENAQNLGVVAADLQSEVRDLKVVGDAVRKPEPGACARMV